MYRIIADDCVEQIRLNGALVDLNSIQQSERCDYIDGFVVPLIETWQEGPQKLEIAFRNTGGPLGIEIRPAVSDWRIACSLFLLLLSLALMVISVYLAGHTCRSPPVQKTLTMLALLLPAIVIRTVYLYMTPSLSESIFSDMANYYNNGMNVISGNFCYEGNFFQGVGYPLVIAGCYFVTKNLELLQLIHLILSVSTVLLSWRAAHRWVGPIIGYVTLAIMTLHLSLVSLAAFTLPETIFAFMLSLAFWLLARFSWPWRFFAGVAVGSLFALMGWFKGQATLFIPLFLGWAILWLFSKGYNTHKTLVGRALLGFIVGIVSVVAIHLTLTGLACNNPRFPNSPSGAVNFVEGKCPWGIVVDSEGWGWHSPLFAQRGKTAKKVFDRPFSDSSYFTKQALKCIWENPSILIYSFRYIEFLFFGNTLWPSNQRQFSRIHQHFEFAMGLFLVPGLLMALLLLFRKPLDPHLLPAFIPIALYLVVWLLKSEMRYRIPFDVVQIPMALMGWAWMFRRIRRCIHRDLAPKLHTEPGVSPLAQDRNLARRIDAWLLALAGMIALAVACRFWFLSFESGDLQDWIYPWLIQLRSTPITHALREGFTNYTPFYEYILIVVNFLSRHEWISTRMGVKLASGVFELLAAYFVFAIVNLRHAHTKKPYWAIIGFLLTPTVILNSAAWGQSDVIYSSFILGSLYYFLSQQTERGFLFFGLALSFKLQTVFFAPFLIWLLSSRFISARPVGWALIGYVSPFLPAIFLGRSIHSLWSVYFNQTVIYTASTMNCANLYQWLPVGHDTFYAWMGISLAVCGTIGIGLWLRRLNRPITYDEILQLGLLSLLLMPFLLPRMHERYYFAADLVSLVCAFCLPRYGYVCVAVVGSSFLSYFPFLFDQEPVPLAYVAVVPLCVIVYLLRDGFRAIGGINE